MKARGVLCCYSAVDGTYICTAEEMKTLLGDNVWSLLSRSTVNKHLELCLGQDGKSFYLCMDEKTRVLRELREGLLGTSISNLMSGDAVTASVYGEALARFTELDCTVLVRSSSSDGLYHVYVDIAAVGLTMRRRYKRKYYVCHAADGSGSFEEKAWILVDTYYQYGAGGALLAEGRRSFGWYDQDKSLATVISQIPAAVDVIDVGRDVSIIEAAILEALSVVL